MALVFDTEFNPDYGVAREVAPNVARLTVNNPSAFTFHGTNTYIVGKDHLAIIDPGPENDEHFDAILKAVNGRPVSHIFVSHTHRDHSPLANKLKQELGAKTVAEGIHRPSRAYHEGEVNMLDAAADIDFSPDIFLKNDETIDGDGWALTGIHTPGHAANHMVFALENTGILFSADHVMAWATSIVAPPDGSMSDFMTSLDVLLARDDRLFLPGHGGAVTNPAAFLRGLRMHRKMRERAILERVLNGDRSIMEIVQAIYRDLDPRLHGAAALSVMAHMEDLVEKKLVQTEGYASLNGIYSPS
ncbi:MBL fold metallo-hydrolase [Brucellaceae bacterium C25G]